MPVDPETTKHDIRCVVRRRSLELLVFEEVILCGSLYDCVDVEECCWTLERCSEVFPPRCGSSIVDSMEGWIEVGGAAAAEEGAGVTGAQPLALCGEPSRVN